MKSSPVLNVRKHCVGNQDRDLFPWLVSGHLDSNNLVFSVT